MPLTGSVPMYGHTEAERDVIDLIVALRDRGHSHYAIAKRLDELGIGPRTALSWHEHVVGRILRRQDRRTDGDARAALADYQATGLCVWCGVGLEVAGAPNCRRCGHRTDVAKYRCDCQPCSVGAT